MEKFKNFLYDKSDIIIAIAILLVAALIIAWRLNAIVEYPKEIIDDNNSTEFVEDTQTEDTESTDETDDATDAPSQEPESKPETKPEANPDEPSNEGVVEIPQDTLESSIWDSNGLLAKDVTIEWNGDYAIEIIQCAVNQGLFEDYNEYANICLNNGVTSPENIPGTQASTFKKGSSKVDIALQIHNK